MKAKTNATSDMLLPSMIRRERILSSVNAFSITPVLVRFGKVWKRAVYNVSIMDN